MDTTRRSVIVSLAVNCGEVLALAVAAVITGSVALRAQTTTNLADVAIAVFLFIGVLTSSRPPDERHPVGYGRERFFWSLFAALAILIGGGGLALGEAVRAALNPSPVDNYPVAYVVVGATLALDAFSLGVAWRPLRAQAATRGISTPALLARSSDPAVVTVTVAQGGAVLGALITIAGLALGQATGSSTPDTVASALIGLMLLVASTVLLRANRDLLTGRGVSPPMLREMRRIVASQPGVMSVPDLFAVVVGPSSLIVDGDVTFADQLNVPAVEEVIERSAGALRARWPSIEYVYLTPVSKARPRRVLPDPARLRRDNRSA